MSVIALSIGAVGMVSSVGWTAPASCAAIRAKISNPVRTRFQDRRRQWIHGHQAPVATRAIGARRFVAMAEAAIEECLDDAGCKSRHNIPLILCLPESSRPGRPAALGQELAAALGAGFASLTLIERGRVSVVIALTESSRAIAHGHPAVLVLAVDSLLDAATIGAFDRAGRILTPANSNGFLPGEAAAALLLRRSTSGRTTFLAAGFGLEASHISSELPLRADGLVAALRECIPAVATAWDEIAFRITDLSGEHYYFREAALALARATRSTKADFETWHAAECIGEVGAAAGAVALILADAAFRKRYAPGTRCLVHMGNDTGERAATLMSDGSA